MVSGKATTNEEARRTFLCTLSPLNDVRTKPDTMFAIR